MTKRKIILASKSPRRSELMRMAGFAFEVRSKDVPEIHPANTQPEDVPAYLAKLKASALLPELQDDELLVGADTIVILDGKVYEKPTDREDAIRMISALCGHTHKVVTGVYIADKFKEIVFSETTYVTFNPLTQEEIAFYVDNYKPYDKAGAYACQEWIGAVAIRKFDGDYFNVVGLPINRVYEELKKF
ncbi:MAG: septum formation protein Maf [Bacteroidetes bacterium]|nr:septum formation protein Maf [Bacteroidota bacterium]